MKQLLKFVLISVHPWLLIFNLDNNIFKSFYILDFILRFLCVLCVSAVNVFYLMPSQNSLIAAKPFLTSLGATGEGL